MPYAQFRQHLVTRHRRPAFHFCVENCSGHSSRPVIGSPAYAANGMA
jgi:hypothetical protein